MCLLTFIPAGTCPDKKHLENSCSSNPHGFGYAIIKDNQEILIGKSLNAKKLVEEFMMMRKKYPDSDALFHSRYATHGELSVDNCHPFMVGKDKKTVLAHNGILPVITPMCDTRSDTAIFAEDILPLYMRKNGGIDNPVVFKSIEEWATGSKLVLLTINPRYKKHSYLFNEKAGHWDNKGIWWSNYGYIKDMVLPTTKKDIYQDNCWTCNFINPSDEDICRQCENCLYCDDSYLSCGCFLTDYPEDLLTEMENLK